MNRGFTKLGDRRKENGARLIVQPRTCWLCGVGRRGTTEKSGALLHYQRDI